MKIAQIAPLYESVPPQLYGGTERVVSYLTEELVRQGHNVTLFASGDSETNACLVPVCRQALRLNKGIVDSFAPHIVELQEVIEHAHEFDVLHFHNDYLHFPVSQILKYPHLTTLHGRLDIAELQPLYKKFAEMPLISISNNQRLPLKNVNWIGTVYHGLPIDDLKLQEGQGNYFAFLGRVSPEKGVDKSIDIAKRTGIKIKIAAKIDKADQEFYEKEIAPLFDNPLVEYIGEISEHEKQDFLGNALALLFPINWPEPFGLVMIEAMATGTPVIAFRSGSVPEVIDDGVTGFVVSTVDGAFEAVSKLEQLNRKKIRGVFEARFTAEIMAKNYLRFYETMIDKSPSKKNYRGIHDHHSESFSSSPRKEIKQDDVA
ncbi:MAG TPA: glycosyltransferase family 4 protein [Chitinophagales bacterium]|nr:glycosyltransferase family 4 protein [Chitinophagales bacterium]